MARFLSFESAQIFPVVVADLEPVAQDVMQYFESQGYQVSGKRTDPSRGWLISIHKGRTFKTVLGMQTALNIELEPTNTSTVAKVSLGIFEQRTIPTTVTAFIGWPILLTQIWERVQESNLDQEALAVVEQRMIAHSRATAAPSTATSASTSPPNVGSAAPEGPQARRCTNCGAELLPSAKFCTSCGSRVVPG
jgi:hypothetical protein